MTYIKSTTDHHEVFPVAVVVSLFNRPITQALEDGARDALTKAGFPKESITWVEVPGAVEIPLVAKQLAKQRKFSAILALGAVIRGETTHYDYVCTQVSSGCQQVALMFDVPVIFGVLTTENEAQAWDRLGGAHGHKGHDAVAAARSMVHVLRTLQVDDVEHTQ
jgi:6,7-dimethyl-8-ribityllumazine synthase